MTEVTGYGKFYELEVPVHCESVKTLGERRYNFFEPLRDCYTRREQAEEGEIQFKDKLSDFVERALSDFSKFDFFASFCSLPLRRTLSQKKLG